MEKFKNENKIESSEKQLLKKLEGEGRWVFHGSAKLLQILNPKQAHNQGGPDGEPAVFASPLTDIAIFRAIINRDNIKNNHRSGFSRINDQLTFRATQETIDQLHDMSEKEGYVYVFDKNKFITKNRIEYVSRDPVVPDQIIKVSKIDLPEDIDVIK